MRDEPSVTVPDEARTRAVAALRAFFEERAGDLAAVCYREEFPSALRRKR